MQDEFEMGMVGELAYLYSFQVKKRKDYTFDYLSIYAKSIRAQLLMSNQMLKYVTRDVITLYCDNKLLCLNFQKDHIFLFPISRLKPTSKSTISSAKL